MLELFPERTIAITVGSWSIRWYGVIYVLAFGIAWWLLPKLQKYRNLKLNTDQWLQVLIAAMLGVIIGGRLGYVLLYNPTYYWQHPIDIFHLWQGGMASHGGFIGVALGLWYVTSQLHVNKRAFLDVIVIPAAIGLALGRVGNLINQELAGVEYELILDSCIAGICWWYLRFVRPVRLGRTGALFLILYGMGRFVLSFWREPDGFSLTMGSIMLYESQLLTLPLAIIGAGLWYRWYATESYGSGEQN